MGIVELERTRIFVVRAMNHVYEAIPFTPIYHDYNSIANRCFADLATASKHVGTQIQNILGKSVIHNAAGVIPRYQVEL